MWTYLIYLFTCTEFLLQILENINLFQIQDFRLNRFLYRGGGGGLTGKFLPNLYRFLSIEHVSRKETITMLFLPANCISSQTTPTTPV